MTFYDRLRYRLSEAAGIFVLAAAAGMIVVALIV